MAATMVVWMAYLKVVLTASSSVARMEICLDDMTATNSVGEMDEKMVGRLGASLGEY